MTVREAAEYLKCSEMAVYQKIYRKEIPHTRLGSRVYILRDELVRELEGNIVRSQPKEEKP